MGRCQFLRAILSIFMGFSHDHCLAEPPKTHESGMAIHGFSAANGNFNGAVTQIITSYNSGKNERDFHNASE